MAAPDGAACEDIMGAWKRCKPGRVCQLCGNDHWCSYTDDGAHTCQKMGGLEVPGFRIIKTPAQTTGGTVYVQEGAATQVERYSAAEWELRKKEQEKERRAAIAQAADLWKLGVENHPEAVAYVEGRGIPVKELPGAALPRSIRCTADRRDYLRQETGGFDWSSGPVLLAAVVDEAGRLTAVQRVFLERGEGKKRAGCPDPKMAKGALKGSAARLGLGLGDDGTLVLTEGVETGLAVLAALAAARGRPASVWACISTSGLKAVELPADMAARGGPLRRIIIAGDYDAERRRCPVCKRPTIVHGGVFAQHESGLDETCIGSGQAPHEDGEKGWRPGKRDADAAAERLQNLHKHLAVGVAIPTREQVPELIAENGDIVLGKTVDWLDVYTRHGAQRVRDSILGVVGPAEQSRPPRPGEEQNISEDQILEEDSLARARRFLRERYAPDEPGPDRGWKLRRWEQQWWRWDGARWIAQPDEGLESDVRLWLHRFWHYRNTRDGKQVCEPLEPVSKTVQEVISALMAEVFVEVERMPVWLAPDFDEHGGPVFSNSRRPWDRSIDWADSGKPDPQLVVACRNGILDVSAWLRRKAVLLPHTELYFHSARLPYDCPIEVLEEVADDDDALDAKIAELCPTWMEFLASVSGGDDEWEEGLGMFSGYCLTPSIRYEIIGVFVGPAGAGKSTYLAVLRMLVGPENVGSSSFNLLTKTFHFHSLIGKNVIVLHDADVGRNTDAGAAGEAAKMISGGDPVYVDRKNKDALANYVLTGKLAIACNRMPNLPDSAGALVRRFRVFPFEESFAGRERREFKDHQVLLREAPGRLLWALRGLRRLEARGAFPQCTRGQQVLDEYANYSDPVGAFVAECVDAEASKREDAHEFTSDLFKRWTEWCASNGRTAHNDGWFGKQLRATLPRIRRVQRDRRWGYEGIELAMAGSLPPVGGSPFDPPLRA